MIYLLEKAHPITITSGHSKLMPISVMMGKTIMEATVWDTNVAIVIAKVSTHTSATIALSLGIAATQNDED